MMKAICLILLLIRVFSCSAQDDDKDEKSPALWGVNYGINVFSRTSLEAGFGFLKDVRYRKGTIDYHGDRFCLFMADLSIECQLSNPFIIGPKLSGRYTMEFWDWEEYPIGLIAGADYIAYNDFRTVNNVFRPSIGIVFLFNLAELSYGYNIRLDDHDPLLLNTHVIQLKIKPFILRELEASQ